MVLSSSDLLEGGLDNTHTMRDTLDKVDLSQIELAVNYINQMAGYVNKGEKMTFDFKKEFKDSICKKEV